MPSYQFSRTKDVDFANELKAAVNNHFKSSNRNTCGGNQLILKTMVVYMLYLAPFVSILIFEISSLYLLFPLYMLMGLGKAFIGTSVMHDALHGTYNKKRLINRIMGYSAFLIGIHPRIWQLQHNVLHHTFTNIEHADEDIAPRYVMRFSPNQPKRWFHRYQHFYGLFFYGISTLVWVSAKDFIKLFHYKKIGVIKSWSRVYKVLLELIIHRIIYFSIFLVVPWVLLPLSFGSVLLLFVTMHMVTGVSLSLIFQTAHVMPDVEFIMTDETKIEDNWLVHQIKTTSNYSANRLLSWFIGGLNYQVEHHLFPNVSHVHYPELSRIVKPLAVEHGLPYNIQKSTSAAITQHFRMLRQLGR